MVDLFCVLFGKGELQQPSVGISGYATHTFTESSSSDLGQSHCLDSTADLARTRSMDRSIVKNMTKGES